MDRPFEPNAWAGDDEARDGSSTPLDHRPAHSASWKRLEAAAWTLRALPAARVPAVKRARRLARDPAYPSPQILQRIAAWLARHWTRH